MFIISCPTVHEHSMPPDSFNFSFYSLSIIFLVISVEYHRDFWRSELFQGQQKDKLRQETRSPEWKLECFSVNSATTKLHSYYHGKVLEWAAILPSKGKRTDVGYIMCLRKICWSPNPLTWMQESMRNAVFDIWVSSIQEGRQRSRSECWVSQAVASARGGRAFLHCCG